MTGQQDDEFRDWDAAYVAGMLRPDERRAFERHLTTCAECSRAVAELAGMPAILGRLSVEEAESLLEAEPTVVVARRADSVQDLARAVSRRRRSLRRRMAAIMAGSGAALAALGLVGGLWLGAGLGLGSSQPDGTEAPVAAPLPGGTTTTAAERVMMTQVEPGYINAELRVSPTDWGTRFDWDCSYSEQLQSTLVGPVPYDLVVTDRTGVETTVASWTAENGASAGNLSASTSIAASDIASVDIRLSGSDQPIVRTDL
ncbi:anti-sigma factor family protein [Herbiconiux liangxiaofengii]|uniref:anti-sigma factor family protein n=1 Tax=Herbiconiux liangxiaofengii TaxID=3342795 RepID=UPI0035B8FC9D